jgi:hypothetical protein
LLPVQGSDTNWYKNLLVDPILKVSVNGLEISARGKLITDSNRVEDVVRKFSDPLLCGQSCVGGFILLPAYGRRF